MTNTMNAALTPQPSTRALLLVPRVSFYVMVACCCCAGSAGGLVHGKWLLPIVLAAVAVAMWHGAYDPVPGRKLLVPLFGSRWLGVFLIGYVALAALTLLLWWLLPFVSLLLFLAYSAWHFGTESDRRTPRFVAAIAACALGAVPIVAACRWHSGAVIPILASMLGVTAAGSSAALAHGLSTLWWPVLAVALIGAGSGLAGRSMLERAGTTLVIACTASLFAFCDPLLAFAVYFCCWHTPEHLVSTSEPTREAPSLRANVLCNLRAGLVPWFGSLVFLSAMLLFGRHAAASYGAEMFIVLSALTVPHMALNELGRLRADRLNRDAFSHAKGVRLGFYRA
jgi:Brp/Blh family beta-carotene 15,15'-monooxygenase